MALTKINKDIKRELAELFGCSEDYVSKVLRGVRANKAIVDAYVTFEKRNKKASEVSRMKVIKKQMKAA